ncbi:MAG TPA: penicillin acylase family protein [Rhodothermales bacterium]
MIIALLLFAGLVVYLAYGINARPPGRAKIDGLSAEVRIQWHNDDFVTIEAASESDRIAALGYAHGLRRSWSIVLWRQAASGRLGEWFGEEVADLDRLARTLGLARTAEETYQSLPDEERRMLEAYTRGLNAALMSVGSRAREFALLGVEVEPWQPWHTLAIERLFAWLATSDLAHGGEPPAGLEAFVRRDRLFRSFLHLGGFAHGAAWTARDSTDVLLVQRQVTGASALPLFFEVRFTEGDSTLLAGATIPGTPFMPAGRSGESAWSLIPSSPTNLSRHVLDPAGIDTLYDRIVLEDADEVLLRTPVFGAAVVIGTYATRSGVSSTGIGDTTVVATADSLAPVSEPARIDSSWVLAWPGLRAGTDLAAWAALARGHAASFGLIDGAGLRLTRSGETQILGNPLVRHSYAEGILVAQSPEAAYAASRLDSIAGDPRTRRTAIPYLDDCRSTWASTLAPRMVALIDTTFSHARFMKEALTYLENWDFSYDQTSIAAGIFDTWVRAYRDTTGIDPTVESLDASAVGRHRIYAALIGALNHLAQGHGTDMSQWRWEVIEPHTFRFPVWSADSLVRVREAGLSHSRFAPIELAGEGHPTALCWGPSPVQDEPSYPGHWESWISTGNWDRLFVVRRRLDSDAFLARYRISERPAQAVALGPESETTDETRLTATR